MSLRATRTSLGTLIYFVSRMSWRTPGDVRPCQSLTTKLAAPSGPPAAGTHEKTEVANVRRSSRHRSDTRSSAEGMDSKGERCTLPPAHCMRPPIPRTHVTACCELDPLTSGHAPRADIIGTVLVRGDERVALSKSPARG